MATALSSAARCRHQSDCICCSSCRRPITMQLAGSCCCCLLPLGGCRPPHAGGATWRKPCCSMLAFCATKTDCVGSNILSSICPWLHYIPLPPPAALRDHPGISGTKPARRLRPPLIWSDSSRSHAHAVMPSRSPASCAFGTSGAASAAVIPPSDPLASAVHCARSIHSRTIPI